MLLIFCGGSGPPGWRGLLRSPGLLLRLHPPAPTTPGSARGLVLLTQPHHPVSGQLLAPQEDIPLGELAGGPGQAENTAETQPVLPSRACLGPGQD